MKEVIGIAGNVSMVREVAHDDAVAMAEVILIFAEPKYSVNEDHELRCDRRAVEAVRVEARRGALLKMIEGLEHLLDDLDDFEKRMTAKPPAAGLPLADPEFFQGQRVVLQGDNWISHIRNKPATVIKVIEENTLPRRYIVETETGAQLTGWSGDFRALTNEEMLAAASQPQVSKLQAA